MLVEGLGDVGGPLARELAELGAHLLLADLDRGKADRLAAELAGGAEVVEVVPLERVPETACDVYAPCAVGATVNAETVPRLRCRIVAGSANNQLRQETDAERLHQRGIVYVPDYIGNAGGAIAILSLHEGLARAAIDEKVEGIGASVREILREADERGESPLAAARRRVERILAAGRG